MTGYSSYDRFPESKHGRGHQSTNAKQHDNGGKVPPRISDAPRSSRASVSAQYTSHSLPPPVDLSIDRSESSSSSLRTYRSRTSACQQTSASVQHHDLPATSLLPQVSTERVIVCTGLTLATAPIFTIEFLKCSGCVDTGVSPDGSGDNNCFTGLAIFNDISLAQISLKKPSIVALTGKGINLELLSKSAEYSNTSAQAGDDKHSDEERKQPYQGKKRNTRNHSSSFNDSSHPSISSRPRSHPASYYDQGRPQRDRDVQAFILENNDILISESRKARPVEYIKWAGVKSKIDPRLGNTASFFE